MIKVSILTVSYNADSTIEQTLLSVCNQIYSDIEYIIVDGKSTDNTLSIINKYMDKISIVVSEPDKGIYDAINKGLALASGDFLLVLGSDDCLSSATAIQEAVSYMTDLSYIYYGNIYRTVRKDIYCGKYNSYKLAVKNLPHQALFYPKHIYKAKNYDMKYRLFADYVYNMELWKASIFKYIPVLVTNYYDGASSATLEDKHFDENYKFVVIKNLGKLQYYYAYVYHLLRNIVKRGKR